MRLATLTRPADRHRAAGSGGAGLQALLDGWAPVLNAIGTNVFVADLDLTLVFANARARTTLDTIDGELRAAFGITSDDIVGGSIHRFHRDPKRVETVLHREQGMTLPHHARFTFGSVTLDTNIDLVRDLAGTHVGYVVAWEDVSALRESNAAVASLGEHLGMAAAAVEELSASIGEIARSATDATTATSRGVEEVDRTSESVRGLGESSEAIGQVVKAITTIAEQTNILALNATIEAARAGEAGRGFAVVAGEVKQLARDTAAATEDIGQRISAIRCSVEGVVTAIDGIGAILREVDEIQSSVAATVEQQRVATDGLAASVGEAAASSREVVARATV